MNVFKRLYCRGFQTALRIVLPILPYRTPKILNNIEELAEVFKRTGNSRALLVVANSSTKWAHYNRLISSLESAGIKFSVFSEVVPDPTDKIVELGVDFYNRENCDCLIAFGGGSVIDCAKAIGARIAYPNKKLEDLKGLLKVLKRIPLLVAFPTTAGTGSETTLAAVIKQEEGQYKYTINSFPLIPSYAILDAQATTSLSPFLTATTGFDALTHAVEAYIGRSTTKQTRECAKQAVKLVFDNILTACENPNDLVARENMLNAAFLAGVAFTKSYVGYIHAIAHSLGGKYGVAHGFANAVLLPVVLKGYGDSVYKKLHELAVYSGISKSGDCAMESAKRFILEIEKLRERVNIPSVIEEIKEEDIKSMAVRAEKEGNPLYPVPKLFDASQLEKFYFEVIKKD